MSNQLLMWGHKVKQGALLNLSDSMITEEEEYYMVEEDNELNYLQLQIKEG